MSTDMLSALSAIVIFGLANGAALIWSLSKTKQETQTTREEIKELRRLALKTMKHLNRLRRQYASHSCSRSNSKQEA